MADKYLQWVEAAAARRPELAPQLADLGELYHKKLWHQLTLKLDAAIDDPAFQVDGFLIDLYQNFLSGFAHKINLLKLAFFAVAASKQMKTPQEGLSFLQDVIDSLEASGQRGTQEPILYLHMQIAQYRLVLGEQAECKRMLQDGEAELGAMAGVDAQVSASVHYLAMQFHKSDKQYAAFYRSALLYLAYIPQDTLPQEYRLSLVVDVSLAALLGEDVYNFGELLLNPIMGALTEGPYAWLHQLLECFNSGDIHRYDALCATHAAQLNSQPALVEHERRLREKITVASLLELVHELPAERRTIPLADVAQRTKLPLDGVEFLLMKALALHLIEGVIDQVAGTVSVSWVLPRVLTMPQVEALLGRVDAWTEKVVAAVGVMEAAAVGVAVV